MVQVENSLKVWQFADPAPEDSGILSMYQDIEGGGGVSDPAAIPFEPHARNLAAFIRSVENDSTFEIDGREARKAVEIILGIYESSASGKSFLFGNNH